jgi:hypothetical protein
MEIAILSLGAVGIMVVLVSLARSSFRLSRRGGPCWSGPSGSWSFTHSGARGRGEHL